MKKMIIAAFAVAAAAAALYFAPAKTETAQFQPCVWPRTCAKPAVVAQFQPCVWPKRCARNDA